jgi:very-short-patch-repair endonuclease
MIHGNPSSGEAARKKSSETKKQAYAKMTKEQIIQQVPWRAHFGEWTKTHREEHRQIMRDFFKANPEFVARKATYLKQGRILMRRNYMTALEMKVMEVLKTLGLSPIWNKAIHFKDNYVFPDFQIPDSNVVIECNGVYWHQDQDKEIQRVQRYEQNGYTPIILEEQLIKQGTQTIIKKLLSYPSFQALVNPSITLKSIMQTTSS